MTAAATTPGSEWRLPAQEGGDAAPDPDYLPGGFHDRRLKREYPPDGYAPQPEPRGPCSGGWKCLHPAECARGRRASVCEDVTALRKHITGLEDMARSHEPAPAEHQNVINNLRKERDGWHDEATALRRRLRYAEADLDVLRRHQARDVWAWQGDGEDHLESMGDSMVVCIHAGDLRALLDAPERGA